MRTNAYLTLRFAYKMDIIQSDGYASLARCHACTVIQLPANAQVVCLAISSGTAHALLSVPRACLEIAPYASLAIPIVRVAQEHRLTVSLARLPMLWFSLTWNVQLPVPMAHIW